MSKNLLKFLIIVKAKRRNGVYIALDMEQGKFIKPALRESTSTWLSKDPDLQIGEEHLFEKSRDPLEISYPHQQDNVFVSYLKVVGSFHVGMLFNILVNFSHQTVKEVFDNMEDFNGEFFHERTRFPSVGIYRCKRKHLNTRFNTDQSERRNEIMEDVRQKPFSFQITRINDELPAVADEEDVLVILSLAKTLSRFFPSTHKMTMLYLSNRVCSSLAAHILH